MCKQGQEDGEVVVPDSHRRKTLLNWEIRDNLSKPQDVRKHGHKSIVLKGPFTADDKSN